MIEKFLKLIALPLLILVCTGLLLGQKPSGSGIGPGDSTSTYKRARILSKPDPESSEGASTEYRITIVLQATFSGNGKVTNINFLRATPNTPKEILETFKRRSIAAAKRIKFIPATRNDRPVSQFALLEYNFEPKKKEDQPATKTPEAELSKPKNQDHSLSLHAKAS
ncbi:MAG: Gram-negative bacterial TonB protein C-terminal [Blastocatellia bacterium]|jgi:hypothetical protein|nr:Gram-negative bacterial TonB protein C-terminal [Blastocatellia bacterium]